MDCKSLQGFSQLTKMNQKLSSNNKNPRVLLIGNGINRAFGNSSWDDIIGKMSCRTYSEKEEKVLKGMPYPLQAVVASVDCVDMGIELFAKELCENKITEQQKVILRKLISNHYDAILTTNYSYEIEYALDEAFSCKYKQKCSHRKTTYTGNTVDEQFGLFKYQEVNLDGRLIPVWHIHGEAARPKSIVLGHYYYGKLLGRLQNYVSNVIRRHEGCCRHEKQFTPISWLDYFLVGDLHIVGLGLDMSEMDLWWLLNCKKINADKLGNGVVTWHEPNLETPQSLPKKLLAETYGMKVDTMSVEDGQYAEYYSKLLKALGN